MLCKPCVSAKPNRRLKQDRRPLDLEEVVEDALHSLARSAANRGISMSVEIPSGLPPAAVNPQQIEDVLTHLVEHAIRSAPGDEVSVRAVTVGPSLLRVSVIDNRRTPPPHKDRGLSEFDRERPEDRSLDPSLHGCRQIVESHGGRIWAERTHGKISAFHFTLPQARSRRIPPQPSLSAANQTMEGSM